jgi:hypothetical protein
MEEKLKWIEQTFNDSEKGQLNFLLHKDFHETHEKNMEDYSIKKINEGVINKRAEEMNHQIIIELDEYKEENIELNDKLQMIQLDLINLQKDKDSLKNSREEDIERERKITVDGKDEVIKELREQLKTAKNKEETILSDFLKLTMNKSSYKKGDDAEKEMLPILQSGGWDDVVDTHSKDHSGDYWVYYNNKKLIIDVKDYDENVPGEQVRKLARNIERNKCDGGAIISLNSGILNPNTNCVTGSRLSNILVLGQSILLLSDACSISPDIINASLKLLDCNSEINKSQGDINNKYKIELGNTIEKMKKKINSEKISFSKRITKEENDLEQLEKTLKEMIGPFDDINENEADNEVEAKNEAENEDDGIKVSIINKPLKTREMRSFLIKKGIITKEESKKLKGKLLKSKYEISLLQ